MAAIETHLTGDLTAPAERAGAAGLCRDILGAVPGAAVLELDQDLCVRLAEGAAFAAVGLDASALVGRVLPDVLSATSWHRLKGPYEAALAGRTSTFDFTTRGISYSIHVAPRRYADGEVTALAVSHEVTEHRRVASKALVDGAAARGSERLLATAFDRAPIGMSVISLDGRRLRVNEAYCRMMGYSRSELIGRCCDELTHPDDVAEDLRWRAAVAAGASQSQEREKRYVARDGSVLWLGTRAETVSDDEGRPACIVSQLQDITERRRSDLALRASERRLSAILDRIPGAVAVKGRDRRYQMVNREFEEQHGRDRTEIVGRRDDEILAAAAVAADRDSDDAVVATDKQLESETVEVRDGEERVFRTVKFGLRDDADALYAVCGISHDITDLKRRAEALHDRLSWTDRIHVAAARGGLVLHGQPIIELATGDVEQAEMLVRMVGEGSSVIPPGEFLPAAERHGLVTVIDRWVVARATELARLGHRVEINLSGRTISDPDHVAEIEHLVVASGAPPENIVFEITETAAAENLDAARHFAERLREMGCSFALDDFGVGFGTFTYLKHLPVDFLKIDIEFVRDLVTDESNRQIVHAIVGVARDFGMRTIAEGVEDEPTLELLDLMGVDFAQGFWIGRPVPIEQLWPSATGSES